MNPYLKDAYLIPGWIGKVLVEVCLQGNLGDIREIIMEGVYRVDGEGNGEAEPHKLVAEEGIDDSSILSRHLQRHLDEGEDKLFSLNPLPPDD